MRSFVSSVAIAAAFFALPAIAQETHTIVPKFPDAFQARTVTITDDVEESEGKRETSHTQLTTVSDVAKTAEGYTGRYRIEAIDYSSQGPDGKPTEDEAMMKELFAGIRDITAIVTLDGNMDPQRVENLDEIKSKAKDVLMASAAKEGAGDTAAKVVEMLFAGMTPESAADLLKQGSEQGSYLNRPFVIGQPVAIKGAPMKFMGTSLSVETSVTLTEWQDGKSAHFSYVMAPNDEEMRGFVGDILKAFMGLAEIPDNPEAKAMIERMVENMHMSVRMTCDLEVSLVNYIDRHSDCQTDTRLDMDMKKILPPEMLEDSPELAKDLPVLVFIQSSHAVADTKKVN